MGFSIWKIFDLQERLCVCVGGEGVNDAAEVYIRCSSKILPSLLFEKLSYECYSVCGDGGGGGGDGKDMTDVRSRANHPGIKLL